jgi:hypothetical protein
LVEKQAELVEGDEVFIWTSERPRQKPNGKGLELRGRLVSWDQPGSSANAKITVRISDRLLETRLSMNGLAEQGQKFRPARRLHGRIHKFRRRRIWGLDGEERKLLDHFFVKETQGEGHEILDDIDRVEKDETINQTTREALVDARLGQGQFRGKLELRWDSRCAVTGCRISPILRASHIKPWNRATANGWIQPTGYY